MRLIILKMKKPVGKTAWNSLPDTIVDDVLLHTVYTHYGSDNVVKPDMMDELTVRIYYVNPNRSDEVVKLETDNLVKKLDGQVLYTAMFHVAEPCKVRRK